MSDASTDEFSRKHSLKFAASRTQSVTNDIMLDPKEHEQVEMPKHERSKARRDTLTNSAKPTSLGSGPAPNQGIQRAEHELNGVLKIHSGQNVEQPKMHEQHILHLEELKEYVIQQRAEKNEISQKKKALKQENRQLKKNCYALQQELQASRDILYSLQPVNQVSDAEIVTTYENLSQRIALWVECAISWAEKTEAKGSDALEICHDNLYGGAAEFLVGYPETPDFLAHHIIVSYIQHAFWNPDVVLFGIDTITNSLLKNIEDSMSLLKPAREQATIGKWRSETLMSLSAVKCMPARQQYAALGLANDIYDVLQRLFPALRQWEVGHQKLFNEIVKPAMSLTLKIQLSPVRYKFFPPYPCEPCPKNRRVFLEELGDFKYTDIRTRRILTRGSQIIPNETGAIGHFLLILEPSLVRYGQTKETLRETVAVIVLDKPLGKRQWTAQNEE